MFVIVGVFIVVVGISGFPDISIVVNVSSGVIKLVVTVEFAVKSGSNEINLSTYSVLYINIE